MESEEPEETSPPQPPVEPPTNDPAGEDEPIPATVPMHFHVKSVAEVKMKALLAMADAQRELARALGSTCTEIVIKDNTFRFEPGEHAFAGIAIGKLD